MGPKQSRVKTHHSPEDIDEINLNRDVVIEYNLNSQRITVFDLAQGGSAYTFNKRHGCVKDLRL